MNFPDHEQAVLNEVNRRVAAAESLKGLVDFLFDSTRDLMPTDRLAIAFLEDNGQRVVAHYARATYEPLVLKAGYAEDLAGSSLQRVIEHGEPRVIDDLEVYLQDHPDSRSTKMVLAEGLRSSMTCPLAVEGRNVGLLFRSSRRPHVYSPHHVSMHSAIAERLSQAVEKAYRIEQLTEANRAYTEMLGFVSHELKSPIASMVMSAKLLTQSYLGELSEKQTDKIDAMIAKGEYLLNLVREYLDLARIESGELSATIKEDVEYVSKILTPSLQIVEPQREEKQIAINVTGDESVTFDCDPDLMTIVTVNLLGNAIKYGNEHGRVKVNLTQPDESHVRISVWNEGPGWPESQQDRLFKRFSRLDTPELKRRKGTGVGLYSTWRIIQLHGGRIRARSEHGQWADFYFTIPVKHRG